MVLQEVERGDDDWAGLAGVEVPCVLVGWEVEGGLGGLGDGGGWQLTCAAGSYPVWVFLSFNGSPEAAPFNVQPACTARTFYTVLAKFCHANGAYVVCGPWIGFHTGSEKEA